MFHADMDPELMRLVAVGNKFPFQKLPAEMKAMVYKIIGIPHEDNVSAFRGLYLSCKEIKEEMDLHCSFYMGKYIDDIAEKIASSQGDADQTDGDQAAANPNKFLPRGWSYKFSIRKLSLPGFAHVRKVVITLPAKALVPDFDEFERARDPDGLFPGAMDKAARYMPPSFQNSMTLPSMLQPLYKLRLDSLAFEIPSAQHCIPGADPWSETQVDVQGTTCALMCIQTHLVALLAEAINGHQISAHKVFVRVYGSNRLALFDRKPEATEDAVLVSVEAERGRPPYSVAILNPPGWRATLTTWAIGHEHSLHNTMFTWVSTRNEAKTIPEWYSQLPEEEWQDRIQVEYDRILVRTGRD